MRNDLHALDKLDVPEDWDSIRTRRPETPHDDTSQRGSTRLLAAAVAILVAIGGGAVLLSAFDKDRGPGPASSSVAPSPAARPLGTDGTLLYPELTLGAYEQMQQDLDSAHGAGTPVQVNPQALATQFAERVMGWEDTAITLEPVANDPRGATLAHARNRKTGAEATITLIQPVTVGVGGVWAVSSVVTPGAELDVQPGDIIANGSHVSGTLDLPAGDHAVAGFQVGEYAASPRCLSSGGYVPEPPTVDIVLKVPSDAASGMSCGVQAIGFVWLETADYRLVGPGYFGNPMVADSSRHSSVSIVPVLVSLPANTTPAGMSTFTDPVNGWRIDYPDEWSLGTDNNVVTVSNGADAGSSSLVSLAVASVPVGEAAIVNRDSQLPLTTGQFSPVGDRSVLNFQENGLPYVATIATGSAASKADVDALSSALGSLRFPALREGDESGPWYAVGPSGAYPSGKGESAYLGPDDLGYVIRAPGGDYALGPNIPSCGEGESYGWDEHSREIVLSCPNGDEARYTINGTPLPGNPTGYTTPLEPYRVVTTWDDVLLTSVHQPLGSDPTGLWP